MGHKQTPQTVGVMSALPPIADIPQHSVHVRFVPKADIENAYSITSSASLGGVDLKRLAFGGVLETQTFS